MFGESSIQVVDFGRQLLAREVRAMAARSVYRAPDAFPMLLEAGQKQMFRLVNLYNFFRLTSRFVICMAEVFKS